MAACRPRTLDLSFFKPTEKDLEETAPAELCHWCVMRRPGVFSDEVVAHHLEIRRDMQTRSRNVTTKIGLGEVKGKKNRG